MQLINVSFVPMLFVYLHSTKEASNGEWRDSSCTWIFQLVACKHNIRHIPSYMGLDGASLNFDTASQSSNITLTTLSPLSSTIIFLSGGQLNSRYSQCNNKGITFTYIYANECIIWSIDKVHYILRFYSWATQGLGSD